MLLCKKAGWLEQGADSDSALEGTPFGSGLGEQGAGKPQQLVTSPAWGLKEIADLSVSRAPLCWSCGGGWLEWVGLWGGGVRGTPDTPEWSHGFTFLRRQLCRKGSWVCVWVSMSAQWRLEEKSKMKEGNEIYCPYALGEWREAVWVKLIRVAECQRQYSTAEKVSDTFAFCTPLKNHKVTTELVWAEAMFLWPYWQSVVLTLQLASSQWPP